MLAPVWSNKIELLDGWYSMSDIEYPFEYILKNMAEYLIIVT